MVEYIDRDELYRRLYNIHGNIDRIDALAEVRAMPAADVVPVVHAHWIKAKSYGEYQCSNCRGYDMNCSDYYSTHIANEQDFCPYCGARMDEVIVDG